MKTPSAFFCAIAIFVAACTKTEIKPVDNSIASSTQDNASAIRTRSALLTSHPWMYKALYFHYVDKNNKGDVEYMRGGSQNVIDLDKTRFRFRSDGTFVELDGGYRYPGTWHFTDNTATVLIMDYTYWTDDCTILTFTSNHLNYTQPMGYGALSFTELIPAQ